MLDKLVPLVGLALVAGCAPLQQSTFESALARTEAATGGRIGVAVLDARGMQLEAYRGRERFAMCSTFKLALAAAILQRVDRGTLSLDQTIAYDKSDIVFHAPVTEKALVGDRGELTIRQLIEAIVQVSDNPAANLLLEKVGGPAGFTQFMRSAGDPASRLDRIETALNENAPGDPRDTTTPLAHAQLVRSLLLGDVLSEGSRSLLREIATGTRTGTARLPAGTPDGWQIAHKTGSCGTAYNDIAVVWPNEAEPYVVTAYVDRPSVPAQQAEAAIAEVARLAAQAAGR